MFKYQLQQNKIIEGKYFIIEMGKSCNSKMEILHHLLQQRPGLKEVHSVNECDVILVFCTIFSRAGTDIDAALNKLSSCSESKPAVFMVLHHTFDPEKVIPDSSRNVTRTDTLTVDCLFHEDEGLLNCKRNEEALTKIVQHFKNLTSYYCLKKDRGNRNLSTDQDTENDPLIGPGSQPKSRQEDCRFQRCWSCFCTFCSRCWSSFCASVRELFCC